MTNPTLTWRLSAPYVFSGAGANMTVAETLAKIKAMVDAEAAGSGLWVVSDYNATNGTLEIKRKPTSDAELTAARILIFGGFSPHASALAYSVTAGAANIYIGVALGAGTAGPEASYTAGSPYPSATWIPAAICVAAASANTAITAGEFIVFESEESFGILGYHPGNCFYAAAGRLVERASDGAALWAHLASGDSCVVTGTDGSGIGINVPWMVPPFQNSYQCRITLWNGATMRCGGNFLQMNTTGVSLSGATAMALLPIPINDGVNAGSLVGNFLGFLRQMRFGPKAGNKAYLRDVNGGLQARMIGAGDGNTQVFGLWLDYVP